MKTKFSKIGTAAILCLALVTACYFGAHVLGADPNVVLTELSGTNGDTVTKIANTGTFVLVGGTAFVADTAITATSRIFYTPTGTSNAGVIGTGSISSGTGFSVVSSSGSDARNVTYFVIHQ